LYFFNFTERSLGFALNPEVMNYCEPNSIAKIKTLFSWAPVAQACNPYFPEDRDQEDCGSKPVLGK
jgi:hypothetical protein